MVEAINFFLIALVALASVGANSLLKFGLKQSALESLNPSYLFKNIFRVVLNPYVLAGLITFVLGALIWLRVLSQEPLGKSYPVFVGMTVVFLIISTYFFLGEQITLNKVLGMALIVAGTYIAFLV